MMAHLHALWHTALEQQEDGDLSKWSHGMIAQAASWEGNPDEFVTRLREWGWLDGSLIHDWIDYVGPYLIKKYSSGNAALLQKIWLKHGYKYGKGNGKFAKQKATRKRPGSDQEATPNRPYPSLPNPSFPNLSFHNLTEPKYLSEGEPTEAQAKGRVNGLTSTVDRSGRTRLDRAGRTAADRNAKTLDEFAMTPELEAWSAKEGIADPGQYVEEFKDYWLSAGGKRKSGQAIKDWDAAFRNRLRALKDQGKLRKKTFDLDAWAREETA